MAGPFDPRHLVADAANRWIVPVALLLFYLVLPGHSLGWLPGLPLGPLGLAALVLFGLVLFATWPLRRVDDGSAGRPAGRPALSLLLGLLVAALCAMKVLIGMVTPAYGLEATYFGKPSSTAAPPERSTEFPRLTATRLDRELHFVDESFPLYFFNDNLRFNYYRPDEPNRATLPFVAHWRGFLDVPTEGEYGFWLTASGPARLKLGRAELTVEGRGESATVERRLHLAAGSRPIEVEYSRRAGVPAGVSVEWDAGGVRAPLAAPVLRAYPTRLPTSLGLPLLWLSRLVDGLYLTALVGCSALLLRGALTRTSRAVERPLLAALLALVLAYAALSSLELRGRVVLLEGGQDWLTYETYARDILLNGPLMTLGRALGKGRPYFFQPFYPYALAAFHWLTGEDLYGVTVLHLFGVGIAGVLVYYLGKRLFGAAAGAVALAIVLGVLGPLQLDWVARHLLSENIYFWLLPGAALAFVALGDRPSAGLAIVAGVLLGLCCVTRGPTLLWVPVVLGITWLRLRKPAFPVLAAVACFAVVALVPLRNAIVANQPSLLATNGVSTIELAHPLTPKVDLRGVERNPVYRALKLDFAVIQLVEFVRQDPQGYVATLVPLGLYALGLPGMLEEGSPPRWELLGLVVLYAGYLAGSALRGRRTMDDGPPPIARGLGSPALILHAFIALHFVIMMVFLPNVYGYRQVLPMYLFLAIFDGAALVGLAVLVRERIAGRAEQAGGRERQRDAVEQYIPGAGAAAGHEELA